MGRGETPMASLWGFFKEFSSFVLGDGVSFIYDISVDHEIIHGTQTDTH